MHILHACDKIDGKEWGKQIRWPRSEIPLNLDAGHKKCPYCGDKLDLDSPVPPELQILLEGTSTGGAGQQGGLLTLDQVQALLETHQGMDADSIRNIIKEELKKALKGVPA